MRGAVSHRAAAPIGMAVFLATWSMLLCALCYAALSLRASAEWVALGPRLGTVLPVAATALVLASSVALARRLRVVGLVAGAAFVIVQGWLLARGAGLGGHSASVLVLLTVFHGGHAVVCLTAMASRVALGRPLGLWPVFWHALALSWLVIVGVLLG